MNANKYIRRSFFFFLTSFVCDRYLTLGQQVFDGSFAIQGTMLWVVEQWERREHTSFVLQGSLVSVAPARSVYLVAYPPTSGPQAIIAHVGLIYSVPYLLPRGTLSF